ncbi:MAG: ATP-binding protein [Candidatus Methanogaster sp.]|uniref:ATP-binding protein n=1 Tax=Candidatus Methanogaster sp. TaxID=3386292 RepID=A0AC61L2B5_9EURY|nr:MAG: ATP-binding protein [ANME-2 cluster archaeon]
MRDIEFHNREKEIKEIRAILDRRPTLITFIYGPINSGKTELINHVIEELPEEYVVFYINLRTKLLASYDDFIESLFEMEMETDGASRKRKETLAELVSSVTKVAGIPINKEFLDYVFKDNKPKNAFSYIIKLFEEVRARGKQPVLVLDELQKIGDVKVNGFLIYELFNFFIDLTKEKHLAHVFVATSDSLFLERVYNEAMLSGRCRYLLVDDFDGATTAAFLGGYGCTDDETALAWEYCGGKPVCLVELINQKLGGGVVKEKCEDIFKVRVSQLRDLLDLLGYVTPQVLLAGTEYLVERENVVEILKDFVDRDVVSFEGYRPEKHFMVKKNILFLDPKEGTVRPQSRLDLLAVREVIAGV